jgi:glutamate-1-semialdehyde 2,1-aminomutase
MVSGLSLSYQEICNWIPGGVNSPVRACMAMGMEPLLIQRGDGPFVFDAEGNRYIDYCGSWGALLHGHCHPQIVKAASDQLHLGSTFGMATEIEGKIAKKIISLIPSIEKIRFVSSGTESTMSAVRLARGYTGKKRIIKFSGNYHGHADPFLVQAGSGVANLASASSAGVLQSTIQHTLSLPYNDSDAVKRAFRSGDIACVIVEPVAANMGVVPATKDFLQTLRQETLKAGALLIFDEVITGFRLGLQGAQGVYGIRPDLTTFGKIIGGGFPAAAFGGKREVMDLLAPLGPVYQAGTLSGNPVAMRAGLEAIELAEKAGFYQTLEKNTSQLIENLPVKIHQAGSLFTLFFTTGKIENFDDVIKCDKEKFSSLYRFLRDRGILIPPSPFEAWFVSAAHTKEVLEETRHHLLAFFA